MPTKKNPPQRRQDAPADELAMHIAAVLNHPDVPFEIYNALGEAVCSLDTHKSIGDSEEYVALYLRAHLEGRARNDARSDTRATS